MVRLIDSSLVFSAHADSWQAQGRLREPCGGGTAELPGWRLMASGLEYSHLNAACMTDPGLADVEAARAWYRERKLSWGAIVPAGTRWPHGRRLLTIALMATRPEDFAGEPAPAGVTLRKAGEEDLETLVAIDNGAFGSAAAPARAWLGPLCTCDDADVAIGELNGVPVAAGYVLRCDGAAGPSLYLGGIGVLPPAAKRHSRRPFDLARGSGPQTRWQLRPSADRLRERRPGLFQARIRGAERHRHLRRQLTNGDLGGLVHAL